MKNSNDNNDNNNNNNNNRAGWARQLCPEINLGDRKLSSQTRADGVLQSWRPNCLVDDTPHGECYPQLKVLIVLRSESPLRYEVIA